MRQVCAGRGVDPTDLGRAIPLGICKVNIDTDGRLVWTRVHREHFRDQPADFDLRGPGKRFVEEYARFVAERSKHLRSEGMLASVRSALAAA